MIISVRNENPIQIWMETLFKFGFVFLIFKITTGILKAWMITTTF